MQFLFCVERKIFKRAVQMRLLHTSDWHLGKRLMDAERLPEQVAVLDEIADICEREKVDVVLVAGDVFDTYLPPAEAEEAFFATMKKLAGDSRAVVLVSGNHDDGVRLAASAPVVCEEGVYLFGNKPYIFPLGGNRPVHAVASGERYLVLENRAGERVYINALPYPNEARLKEDKTEETYSEKVARWISCGDAGYDGKLPYVLLTHLFVAGGTSTEGERNIDLGGARAVNTESLPRNGYVALGHLHKKQRVGNIGRYSGSILQYSFDEANTEKSVVLLNTTANGIAVEKEIPLTAGKKLVRLEARGVDDALRLLERYPDCYVELTLHLTAPLTVAETLSLRERNEGLVSLITRVNTEDELQTVSRSSLTPKELFEQYYRSKFGEDAPAELTAEFLAVLGEEA